MSKNFLGKNRLNANMTIRDGSANYIVAYIMQFLLQFLFTLILMSTNVSSDFQETLAYTCIICIINQSANLITPIAYSKVLGQNFVKDVGFKWKLNLVQVILLVFISLATIMAFSPLASFFVEFILKTGYDPSTMVSMNFDTPSKVILAVFFVCLLPALCEELIYRGIIARAFKSKNIIFMILMSSFLFAIMHGSPIQLVHQFFMGCICCIVYLLTRQIWAPVIVHFTNNFVAVIGNYIVLKSNILENDTPVFVSIIMIIIGIILLVLLLYLFYLICKERNIDKKQKDLSMLNTIDILFKSDKEKENEMELNNKIQENLLLLDTEEKKEVYLRTVEEAKQKNGLIDRRALIFALLLGLAVWIMNTILGYIS